MKFNPNTGLRFDFTALEKESILMVLAKFGDGNQSINGIRNAVADTGWTSLHADEALMLAGLLLPWYEFLSRRIIEHPGIFVEVEA